MCFQKIRENVVMTHTADSSYLSIEFNSTCDGYNPRTHKCQVRKNEEVEYTVNIKVGRFYHDNIINTCGGTMLKEIIYFI